MGVNKKNAYRKIREVANKLPMVTIPTVVKLAGAEILKANAEAKDAKGVPISADKVYSAPAEARKNHYRAMKKIFKEGGVEKVNEYIRMVVEMAAGKQKLMKETLGGMAERENSITRGF